MSTVNAVKISANWIIVQMVSHFVTVFYLSNWSTFHEQLLDY